VFHCNSAFPSDTRSHKAPLADQLILICIKAETAYGEMKGHRPLDASLQPRGGGFVISCP